MLQAVLSGHCLTSSTSDTVFLKGNKQETYDAGL